MLRCTEHEKKNYLRSRCAGKLVLLDDRVSQGQIMGENMQPHAWEAGRFAHVLHASKSARIENACETLALHKSD